MAGTKYFADLTPLPAFDANKVLAVENDPVGTGGWKAHVSTDGTFSSQSDAILPTQKAVYTYTTYSNSSPTPVTIGGIPAGSTFSDQSTGEMWNKLLYPYQYPAFTGFVISGQAVIIEVGNSISGAKTFAWSTSNSGNIQANSINIIDVSGGNIPLFTGLANDGSEPYTFPSPIQLVTQGAYVWQIQGTNTLSQLFTRNYTVSWYWLVHSGMNVNTTLSNSDILALANSSLTTTFPGQVAFAGGGYFWYWIPSSFVQPSVFKDHATGFAIDMQAPVTQAVTNAYGVVTNYKGYRSTYVLVSALTVDIS